jgi:hypothetical protein
VATLYSPLVVTPPAAGLRARGRLLGVPAAAADQVVGNIVGMAYVVARPKGRFEIRESVHTPKGPRARSLANFSHLSDVVLVRANERATRPFDRGAVRAAARAAARSREARTGAAEVAPKGTPHHGRPETREFVEASRRMARSVERIPPPDARRDPGDLLIGLLGFVAMVKPFGPERAPEPLRFPPLARLREERIARANHR